MALGHLSDTFPRSLAVTRVPLGPSGPASVGLAPLVGMDTDATTPGVLEPVLTLRELLPEVMLGFSVMIHLAPPVWTASSANPERKESRFRRCGGESDAIDDVQSRREVGTEVHAWKLRA